MDRPSTRTGSARVLVNPAAGRGAGGRALPELERLAGEASVDVVVSRDPVDLEVQAARSVEQGVGRLLVAGGDGALHHAVQALAGSRTALGVLPVGSGNDLAATLGVSRRLAEAFRQALTGPVRALDLGRVRRLEKGGGEAAAGRYFAGVAGVGFDSEVARTILETQEGPSGFGRLFRGSALYVYGVVRTLGSFRPPRLILEHAGGRWEGEVILVAFGNTHRFGGGMRIAPHAVPDDGLLDVVLVRRVPKATLLRVFPRVYRGTHLGHPAVETFRAREVVVALDRGMTVYGDGEPMVGVGGEDGVGGGEVVVEVVPGALRVVMAR